MNSNVQVSYHILSNINNCMTVAFCVNGTIASIVAGESNEMYRKLLKVFG